MTIVEPWGFEPHSETLPRAALCPVETEPAPSTQ